jgi:hypothetical protein
MTLREMLILHNETIEKARALPVGTKRHGRIKISANPSIWKPISTTYKLKERNELTKMAKKRDIESYPVISLKKFCKQVDLLYAGGIENEKKIRNIIRLPDFNVYLARRLGVTSKCYFTKNQMTHCRPSRKETYDQALRIEEFKRIPKVIQNSKILYYDKMNKNFFIPFRDRENPKKVNKIVFNKDKRGNYSVSVGKVEITTLKRKEFIKLGVGNNPQIHKSKDRQLELHQQYQSTKVKELNSPPITRFSESSVFNDEIIPQSDIKSIHKAILVKLKNIERMIRYIDKVLTKSLQRK